MRKKTETPDYSQSADKGAYAKMKSRTEGSTPAVQNTTINKAATVTTPEVPRTAKTPRSSGSYKTATASTAATETPKTKRNPIGNLGEYAHPSKKKGRK